ncbi:hypothetical protein MTR67_026818 [Solanum verrucosum]|uniref:Uncharacterized protein n=1 Tax=Solanum verrucosum TaxID=315347 RepID=A0AAF0R2I1_SOLVR|nr:hypothetical protein MTR67_026818 [Solanum verrucosum]
MSSGGDGDRHREHLGVRQTKQDKKKKSRRPIDPEDIAGSISSVPKCISHDTHILAGPFGTADPRQYYPNYHRPVGTPSPIGTSLQLFAMRIRDSSSEQSYAMAGTPPLTQHYVHPDVSPSTTTTPSAIPNDEMPPLVPGQKDKLGRVMIEPDGSSWHPAKDAARALKDCVRRLYTQVCIGTQTSLSQYQAKPKKARGSLNGGSLHTGGAKSVGTIAREMEKELGRTPIEPEVFKKTRVRKKENESDPHVWMEERAERTFNDFHQYVAENLDSSVQLTPELSTQIWKEKVVGGTHKDGCYGLGSRNDITAMSAQIAQLTSALEESERRRVAEQQSMSRTIQ